MPTVDRMRVLVGTSGFSYPAWKGAFYPPGLPAARMLAWYASRLPAVEANSTFYRLPRPEQLAGWRAQVPPGFVFALKAPQRVTHAARLRDAGAPLGAFYRAAAELGPALGPVLFQLPPGLRCDLPRLEDFLASLPPGGRAAFEFRHPSWLDDRVFAALSRAGAALCLAESDDAATPPVATGGFGYLRLRRSAYTGLALRAWAERILAQPWAEAVVFFKHEEAARGPAFARALQELLGGAAAGAGAAGSPTS
jgi:uncharacterized protein YecE (DUF72 family)